MLSSLRVSFGEHLRASENTKGAKPPPSPSVQDRGGDEMRAGVMHKFESLNPFSSQRYCFLQRKDPDLRERPNATDLRATNTPHTHTQAAIFLLGGLAVSGLGDQRERRQADDDRHGESLERRQQQRPSDRKERPLRDGREG